MKKAVSARLFSAAMCCINGSDNHVSNGHTAAGLPPNSLSVNASTWYMLVLITRHSLLDGEIRDLITHAHDFERLIRIPVCSSIGRCERGRSKGTDSKTHYSVLCEELTYQESRNCKQG